MLPARVAVLAVSGLSALATGYLLSLLLAARLEARRSPDGDDQAKEPRFTVLIPAHDEAAGIGRTLANLRQLDYPADRYRVVVIADNCTDETAVIAERSGVQVLVRHDPLRRGKGYALAWALERLGADEESSPDAFVFLDADCDASPNLLRAVARRMAAGFGALQTDNVVANPGDSWVAALRFAAFSLINTVQPLGKSRLGLSCGLKGTGMALSADLLRRYPWDSFRLAEDGEYHCRLLEAGERVGFVREAAVSSAMPVTLGQSRSQQLRWEGGRWQLIRTWTPRLLRQGLRRRDPGQIHGALEPLIPPQSLLLAANVVAGVLALALSSPAALALALFNLLGQAIWVVGGMAICGAPRGVYRALAAAPLLMVWKLGLYGGVLTGRVPANWTRTPRRIGDR